jgi:hypothetical protein
MALDLTGISNHNDYYSQHYLLALIEGDLNLKRKMGAVIYC